MNNTQNNLLRLISNNKKKKIIIKKNKITFKKKLVLKKKLGVKKKVKKFGIKKKVKKSIVRKLNVPDKHNLIKHSRGLRIANYKSLKSKSLKLEGPYIKGPKFVPHKRNYYIEKKDLIKYYDDYIPKITGLKDAIDYEFIIEGIDYSTYPPTIDSSGAKIQFTFRVNQSFRNDFPNYNNGDKCDPSYQGNGNLSYLLLDFFVADTHQTTAKIIIFGPDKIGNNSYNYTFNFFRNPNSLLNILASLKPGERITNISVVISPYDNNDYTGFPIVILIDKFANSFVLNQTKIDFLHTTKFKTFTGRNNEFEPNPIEKINFQVGSYDTNFFITPKHTTNKNNSNLINIKGMCNNNQYGVNFLFNSTTADGTVSKFNFFIFPYSNATGYNSDFPTCVKDISNNSFGTLYANDSSIRIVSAMSKSITPNSPKLNYFQFANLRNTLILRPNNLGIDSLIKMNPTFFKNTVIIPESTKSSCGNLKFVNTF